MNSFQFIGKIQAIKATDNFAPIERKNYDSGWTNTIVRFNCVSGTNRVMCLVQGGKWVDDKKNGSILTMDKDRNKIEVPWSRRHEESEIEKVIKYRRFIVDLADSNKRNRLKYALKVFENGNQTEELMQEVGCKTLDEVKAALEKSKSRCHQFLSEWDFAEYMTKVVASEKIKDSLFKISGIQENQYSPSKGRFYTNYRVNRVELVSSEEEKSTKMMIDFYFDENCIDDSSFENDGKAYLNGFTTYYDNSLKATGMMPIPVVVRDEKKLEIIKKRFTGGDSEIKNIGLAVDVIDGAEMLNITYDDLDDESKEDVDCGTVSLKDAIAALGRNKVGDRITELRYCGWNAKKNKVEDTTYKKEDMKPAEMKPTVADDDDDDIL